MRCIAASRVRLQFCFTAGYATVIPGLLFATSSMLQKSQFRALLKGELQSSVGGTSRSSADGPKFKYTCKKVKHLRDTEYKDFLVGCLAEVCPSLYGSDKPERDMADIYADWKWAMMASDETDLAPIANCVRASCLFIQRT